MASQNTTRKRPRESSNEIQMPGVEVVKRDENLLLREMGRYTINIFVGPKWNKFVFDKAGLAYHSDYFLQAIYGQSHTDFYLESDEPVDFELFSRWMNTRSLKTSHLHLETPGAKLAGVNTARLFAIAEKYQVEDMMKHSYGLLVASLLDGWKSLPNLHLEHALRMWELTQHSRIRNLPLSYLLSRGTPYASKWLSERLDCRPRLSRDVARLTLFASEKEFKLCPAWFESFRGTNLEYYYTSIAGLE
ncbi:hypothetical protein MMC10_002823 [Thelotrema lepadinum]|nr:hypothetical protein [Thelotrema lepadinum]